MSIKRLKWSNFIEKVNVFQPFLKMSIKIGHVLIDFVTTIKNTDLNSFRIFDWNPRRLQNLLKFCSRSIAWPKLTLKGVWVPAIEVNLKRTTKYSIICNCKINVCVSKDVRIHERFYICRLDMNVYECSHNIFTCVNWLWMAYTNNK